MRAKLLALCAGASVLAVAAGAWAQPSPQHVSEDQDPARPLVSAGAVPEIVVTANRRKERLQDVPMSITAETAAMLRQRGAHDLEDIVANTPGLSNPGSGAGSRTNLTVRGVTTGTDIGLKQSTVSLLLDDIPVDPGTAGLATTNLRVVDVQRVEILRGPQGTLFGSGALSGAVRYVTNKPDMDQFEGVLNITGAGAAHGAGSAWGDGMINLPIIQDKLAIRAVGYGFDEGGWIDNIRTGAKDINRTTSSGGRLEIAAKPMDRLTLSATLAYQADKDDALGESLYAASSGVSDPTRVTNLRLSTPIGVRSTIANFDAQYDLGAATLTSSTTYIRRKVDEHDDLGYFNDYLGALFSIPGLTGSAPSHTWNDQSVYMQEIRLSSRGAGPLKWTLGGFYQRTDSNGGQLITSQVIEPLLGVNLLGDLASHGRQEEFAGFGELTYTVASQWDLTVGARYAENSVRFTTRSSGLVFTGQADPSVGVMTNIDQKEPALTPRVSLDYRPVKDLMLYIQAARGYRVGGPNLTAGLGGSGIPTAYKSDSLWNYEVGAKSAWLGGRVKFDTDVYYIDWSNLQTSLVLNAVNYTGNAGAARIIGFENELHAQAASWLEIGGTLSFSSSALTENVANLTRSTGLVGVHKGERLPGSPAVQTGLYGQANFTLLGRDAYVRADTHYVGPEYTDFGEKGTRFGDYATADLRSGVHLGDLDLTIFATNLLDSDRARGAYDATSVGSTPALPQLAFRLRPRTVGVTASAHF